MRCRQPFKLFPSFILSFQTKAFSKFRREGQRSIIVYCLRQLPDNHQLILNNLLSTKLRFLNRFREPVLLRWINGIKIFIVYSLVDDKTKNNKFMFMVIWEWSHPTCLKTCTVTSHCKINKPKEVFFVKLCSQLSKRFRKDFPYISFLSGNKLAPSLTKITAVAVLKALIPCQ